MHTRSKILVIQYVLCILYFVLLVGCRGDEIIYPTIPTEVTEEVQKGGLYVLCEGNMGSNKARIDYMNLETGIYYANWYGAQNPKQMKELGDVGNDIQAYGHRLYAVINCSHKVEVMDLQARHIGKVDIPNCRYLAFYGDKMYVSAYVGSMADPELLGSVFEVDTATLTITREVKVGHQPDELCVVNNQLIVCNSGGYLIDHYDSTLSVIDLESFTQIRQIPVGLNPTRVRVDQRKQLWVCCQGNYKDIKPQLVVHDMNNVLKRISTSCSNLSVQDTTVYVLDKEANKLRAFSIMDYTERACAVSLEAYENPYGLLATQEALYVTDAKNYVSSGMLHCYAYDGKERWQALTGDIPGHLCSISQAMKTDTVTPDSDSTMLSPYIYKVYEYVPALGQFVNELPKYEEGDDAASMCRKCETAIAANARGLVSLGGWGGYITFGFDHPVENKEGKDLQILGNAFLMAGNTAYGSSEPGIVLVSRDDNNNGFPDDKWYELKGCLYDDPGTQHNFSRTYTREGDTLQNPFHKHPYYPQWITADHYTLRGARLAQQTEKIKGQNVQRILEYGYVDNKPNIDVEGTSFDIAWAVDADGHSVSLPTIDFIRVYNASDEILEQTGELSTEVTGAIDLHCNQ